MRKFIDDKYIFCGSVRIWHDWVWCVLAVLSSIALLKYVQISNIQIIRLHSLCIFFIRMLHVTTTNPRNSVTFDFRFHFNGDRFRFSHLFPRLVCCSLQNNHRILFFFVLSMNSKVKKSVILKKSGGWIDARNSFIINVNRSIKQMMNENLFKLIGWIPVFIMRPHELKCKRQVLTVMKVRMGRREQYFATKITE